MVEPSDVHDPFIFYEGPIPRLPFMRDQPLSFTQANGRQDGTVILSLSGPLTLGNLFEFQNAFRAIQPPALIVDMSGTTYMDSAGLGLLMNGYVSAQNHGRRYVLAGVNERVRALLEMTRVDSVLQCYASAEEAEAALGS